MHGESGDELERRAVEVGGIVQGVGFRPFVFGLARGLPLAGFVRNHSRGVTIEVEGSPGAIATFLRRLESEAPPLARIDSLESATIPALGTTDFAIVESVTEAAVGTPISPDVTVCDDCLTELGDPADRRFGYPFVNCTNCGPRFTITRDIPYDRPSTTMASFPMCEPCATEYRDPANRRFHAQPNACPDCGPRVWFVDPSIRPASPGRPDASEQATATDDASHPAGVAAIEAFRQAIALGRIIAVKGIGGFHLACDATDDTAIDRLRTRKGRGDKPFAIMVPNVDAARDVAEVDADEERLLRSRPRPIVLLKRRRDARHLSPRVAPGNESIGVMLPDSPLHHLLLAGHSGLVMTSGNVADEPIARTNDEAIARLDRIADAFLLHDRGIHVVCDDSVVRVFRGHELPIRRSRGYAPLPIRLRSPGPSVLAVGGELKATFCVTKGDYAYISPHIGDMGNLETLEALERGVRHFRDLFRVQPLAVARDSHPGYLSHDWAARFAASEGIPLVDVQHHHAHVAALRVEHGCREPVLGFCFDGTGYGTDGAIWGGEVLQVTDDGFERLAHLRYRPLPGGDAAIRRPYRTALSHLWAAGLAWDDDLPCVAACPDEERRVLRTQLERHLNCTPTSSMGRLFDAVASLIGVRHVVDYEAQAAMELEACAVVDDRSEPYRFVLDAGTPFTFDPTPLFAAISDDLRGGVSTASIAGRFHVGVAEVIREACRRVRDERGLDTVALTGGVFQNVLLLELAVTRLQADGFRVLVHREVPPNDGGLALGQAVVARRALA